MLYMYVHVHVYYPLRKDLGMFPVIVYLIQGQVVGGTDLGLSIHCGNVQAQSIIYCLGISYVVIDCTAVGNP